MTVHFAGKGGILARPILVLCNGEPPSRALVRQQAKRARLTVAADGGANMARRYGVVPDIILGDLDSLSLATRRHFHDSLILYVGRQDNTDLEKSLDYVAAHGGREVVIMGVAGRRIDFTLGNFSVLWKYTAFLDLTIVGDGWRGFPVGRRKLLRARPGTIVSLIPFGRCEGITLRGLQYPLTNASMEVGDIGVSNIVRSSPFSVSVRSGKMLVFLLDAHGRRVRAGR